MSAQTPMQVLYPLNTMLFAFCTSESSAKRINEVVAHVQYFPFAILFTASFMVLDALLVPVAYVSHLGVLIKKVTEASNMSKSCDAIFNVLRFMFIGLLLLVLSIVVDTAVFAYNLYTSSKLQYDPAQIQLMKDAETLTKEALLLFESVCDEIIEVKRK